MKYNRNSGQITVLLSIGLLAILILAGVLVDAARISAAGSLVKSAVSSAARSALAGYCSRLKENYGLFGFDAADEEELENTVRHYLGKNLQINGSGVDNGAKVDLYGFRIESIHVFPLYNMSENKVFKQQILEYMKYRAPGEIAEGFMDRLSAVREMGKMSAAYGKKVGLDKVLGKLDKAQQSLKKNVDGSGGDTDKYINGFNLNGIWEKTFTEYLSRRSDLKAFMEEMERLETELQKLQQEKSNSGTGPSKGESTEGGEEGDGPENRMNDLKSKKAALDGKITGLENSIKEIWENLRYALTEDYTASNEKAVKDIDKIIETGKKVQELITGLETFLDGSFAGDNEFAKTLREDVNKIKKLLLEGRQAADMIKTLENNALVLKQLAQKLDLVNSQPLDGSAGSMDGPIPELLSEYDSHVEYSYEMPEKGGKAEDPRKDKVRELKDALLEQVFDDRNLTAAGIIPEELPSSRKAASKSFEEEDAGYTDFEMPDEAANAGTGAGYGGELGNIAGDADLYDEEGMFQENAFGFMGSIGDLLEGDLNKLRDNVYLNEYIMGMFKNQVLSVKQAGNGGDFTFLNGTAGDGKETFFECEVEYILHGDSSEITNKVLTNAQILLLRLGANTLHVYADAKKRELSVVTATAVAGWWTGGAGIPVISNLIMCAWGMGEAVLDLKALTAGEPVPIYKSSGDWKLDIGLPGAGGPKTDVRLYFSYQDYLRLFLLAMNEEEKLGRMEDLIEINTGLGKPGFKAAGCNTGIRVEAEISMKNIFLPQPFMPDSIRTADGRRKIRVLVYEGY